MIMIEFVPLVTYLDGTPILLVSGVKLASISVEASDHRHRI
jgi:hypothetical protein